MALWINLGGLILIGLIVWWFWLSKPKASKARSDVIDVLVDNGVYTPSRIEVAPGQLITLRFLRKDASPCAEKVIFQTLGLSADLPLDEAVELKLSLPASGEYEFTCQMQMYRGSLVAR